jgi:hypothetical protein
VVPPSAPPQLDPASAKPEFWLGKPAAVTIYGADYDRMWEICSQVATADLFSLDRQDYREGVLTTHPMV